MEIFSYSIKDRKQYPRKLYVVDNGIIRAIYPEYMEDMGRLMENTVFIELKRMEFAGKISEIYYWKDYQQREVDFVVREGVKVRELIQVTYASEMDEIEKREIKGLLKASKELKCKNLKVITWDYESEEEFKNKRIEFIPLWRWLLSL
ncbi:hypothetical protein DRQ11_14765 [candidate division KSB1 bacterium]|nr:MAG: hypothetical protein DRQ11_14765 [candidate division KSB1 bacterium]